MSLDKIRKVTNKPTTLPAGTYLATVTKVGSLETSARGNEMHRIEAEVHGFDEHDEPRNKTIFDALVVTAGQAAKWHQVFEALGLDFHKDDRFDPAAQRGKEVRVDVGFWPDDSTRNKILAWYPADAEVTPPDPTSTGDDD